MNWDIEKILKRNAFFLLELKPSENNVMTTISSREQKRYSRNTFKWTIDVYPQRDHLKEYEAKEIPKRHTQFDDSSFMGLKDFNTQPKSSMILDEEEEEDIEIDEEKEAILRNLETDHLEENNRVGFCYLYSIG